VRSDRLDWRPLIGAEQPAGGGEEALRRVKCDLTEPLFKRLLRKLFPDQRKQERFVVPPLVGYLGSVRSTKPYEVGDISLSGFCLLTEEQWSPGTEMPVTLEKTSAGDIDSEAFTVQATVVRCGDAGVGFSILLSEEESKAAYGNPLRVRWASKPEMRRFLSILKEPSEPSGSSNQMHGDGRSSAPIASAASAESTFEIRHAPLTQTGSD